MSIKVTWYGHAAFGVQVGDTHLLVDPFLTDNPAAAAKADEVKADYILVSHGHSDHVGDTVAIAKRTGATVISNFEICTWLQDQGVPAEQTHPQHIGGGFQYPFGYVKLTIAHHGSALPDGTYGGNPAGFLITAEGKKLYFACDTGLFYDMKLIGDEGVEAAFLPIGDNFTMGPEDALRAVELIRPKTVVPIHYNTWDLIAQDPQTWAEQVKVRAEAQVVVLNPGESYEL